MWQKHSTFYISDNPQGSATWLAERKGRVTMTKFGALLNHSDFCTPNKAIQLILGQCKETFTDKQLAAMKHGNDTEPLARSWYENLTNRKVIERGLAVPTWNPYLGASTDGEVVSEPGLVEIKCPQKMYYKLKQRIFDINAGKVFDKFDHTHIFDSHYDQMQGNMAVLNKEWCDYIVYCTNDECAYVETVPFNLTYWQKHYPLVNNIIETQIKPYTQPILPPNYEYDPDSYPYE